jgi:hypothetical protein
MGDRLRLRPPKTHLVREITLVFTLKTKRNGFSA